MNYVQLAKRWVLIALGVLIASETSSGIYYDSNAALVVAVLFLSLLSVFAATLNAGGLTIHRADDGDWDLVHQCLPVPDGRGLFQAFTWRALAVRSGVHWWLV